jgi:hypothetical protein
MPHRIFGIDLKTKDGSQITERVMADRCVTAKAMEYRRVVGKRQESQRTPGKRVGRPSIPTWDAGREPIYDSKETRMKTYM